MSSDVRVSISFSREISVSIRVCVCQSKHGKIERETMHICVDTSNRHSKHAKEVCRGGTYILVSLGYKATGGALLK